MNTNTYFIIDNDPVLFDAIFDYVVEMSIDTTRRSVDGTKIVVKLPLGDSIPDIFSGYTPYSHGAILDVMGTPERTNPDLFL